METAGRASDKRHGDAESADPQEDQRRKQAIDALVTEVMQRRARGESLPDLEIIDAHRDLMPELSSKLAVLNRVCRAFWEAEKIGLEGAPPPSTPTSDPAQAASLSDGNNDDGGLGASIFAYTVLQEISSGGQGTVFKAVQRSTGRIVALKIIPGGPLMGSHRRARFEREADILARLQHPNIVGIVDRGRMGDGSLFIAMEFVEGHSLDEYLAQRRERGPNTHEIVQLYITIARAIHDVHQQDIVHRDLKPSNIRIDRRGHVRVLDFGLARLTGDPFDNEQGPATVTLTGQIIGSLPWASPEHVCGDSGKPDARSDVYSLGVMLYHALTGAFPYPIAGPLPKVIQNILQTAPAPPSQVKQDKQIEISPILNAVILRALAKSPEQRQATARQLAAELEACLAGSGAMPARWSNRLKWTGRYAVLAASVVVAVVAGYQAYQRHFTTQPVTVFELPAITNSVGMRLMCVPAGQFRMGSLANENGRNSDEMLHIVSLSRAFHLSTIEVTQRQYQAVMGQLPRQQKWVGDNLPVHRVQWDEAVEFCRKLSEKEGRKYRLPTEAEWEYACRTGVTARFAGTGRLDDMGWHSGNSGGQLHSVASKSPNHWGLYDMHGNVREWCLDGYVAAYPLDKAIDPLIESQNGWYVARGGSAMDGQHECRSACRRPLHFSAHPDEMGFRVVLEADAQVP